MKAWSSGDKIFIINPDYLISDKCKQLRILIVLAWKKIYFFVFY